MACCVSSCAPTGQPIARVVPIPSSRTVSRNVYRMAPSFWMTPQPNVQQAVSNKSALFREPRTFFCQDQDAVQNFAESLGEYGPSQAGSPLMTLGSLLG